MYLHVVCCPGMRFILQVPRTSLPCKMNLCNSQMRHSHTSAQNLQRPVGESGSSDFASCGYATSNCMNSWSITMICLLTTSIRQQQSSRATFRLLSLMLSQKAEHSSGSTHVGQPQTGGEPPETHCSHLSSVGSSYLPNANQNLRSISV